MSKSRIDRRNFLISAGSASLAAAFAPSLLAQEFLGKPVRVAFIGVGARGTGLLQVLLKIPGTTVPAICDIDESHLNRAIQIVEKIHGNIPAGFSKGPYDYRRMLERDDFDAVLIATPVKWHAPMSIDAMKAGKHVGSEVPASDVLEELWELVRTKVKTGKHYMLLENYIYSSWSMLVYNMAQKGLFGDIYYGEGAYIHDCKNLLFGGKEGILTWRGEKTRDCWGQSYSTHALGPVSKWMGINDGDRLEYMTTMMNKPRALQEYVAKKFGTDSKQAKIDFARGDMTSSFIQTAKGNMIRIDFDMLSPRRPKTPYLLQGTKGIYDKSDGFYFSEGELEGKNYEELSKDYQHPYWKNEAELANKAGHGGGDYFVVRDMVDMIRYDREPWIDVYDAATWSVLYHCSQLSIQRKSASVDIPDFTAGRWKDPNWRKINLRPTVS